MTDNNHPITPPDELVQRWKAQWFDNAAPGVDIQTWIATNAARWGADMELVACMNYVDHNVSGCRARALREHRRPKPERSAEEALTALEQTVTLLMPVTGHKKIEHLNTIRVALERLRELEGKQ